MSHQRIEKLNSPCDAPRSGPSSVADTPTDAERLAERLDLRPELEVDDEVEARREVEQRVPAERRLDPRDAEVGLESCLLPGLHRVRRDREVVLDRQLDRADAEADAEPVEVARDALAAGPGSAGGSRRPRARSSASAPNCIASSSSPARSSLAKPSMPTNESRSRARISRNFVSAS